MSTARKTVPDPLDSMLHACAAAAEALYDAPTIELRAECDDEAIAGLLYDLGPGRLFVSVPFAPRGMTREWASKVLADCVRDGRIKVPAEIAARIERGEEVRSL